uniref:Rhomboid family intramembrane serine protease n=1 Tax=Roseihalotalea indica TaxID=2867963 RepID=A0AA49GQB8_9BACT|nr:rhomboid family intramembrane serine protease [Tunicatimonas sp. TK19036]
MSLSITTIIIIITVIASLYAWNRPDLLQRWMFNPYAVQSRREYHRFITSGFIHQDYLHLFFNMFTLYFFGNMIEQTYAYVYGSTGLILYVVMYLVAIIVSDISTYAKHKNNPNYNSLGASGGVAAVVFSAILYDPTNNIYLFAIIPIPGFILGALFLIYSYQRSKQTRDRINHDAHLWGALFGVAFTVVLNPPVISHFIQEISNFRLF